MEALSSTIPRMLSSQEEWEERSKPSVIVRLNSIFSLSQYGFPRMKLMGNCCAGISREDDVEKALSMCMKMTKSSKKTKSISYSRMR